MLAGATTEVARDYSALCGESIRRDKTNGTADILFPFECDRECEFVCLGVCVSLSVCVSVCVCLSVYVPHYNGQSS